MEAKKNPKYNLDKYSNLFMATGLCISLLVVITAFEWKFYDKGNEVDLGQIDDEFDEIIEIPVTQQPPPPPPKVTQPEIIEVPDEEEIEEDIEVDLDVEMTEDDVMEEIIITESEEEEEEVEEIFTIVEEEATPKGGYKTFYSFVSKNLKYPTKARKAGISGKVILTLTIGKDGKLADAVVAKGIGFGCDEEAVRVVKAYNAGWNPGKQRGRPVKTRMYLPLTFKLN